MPQHAATPSSLDAGVSDAALPRRRPGHGTDPEATIKSLAKAMARDTTARIPDRHLRAEVRTDCYNQIVTVLQQVDARRVAQRVRQQRTQGLLVGVVLILGAALAVSLAV